MWKSKPAAFLFEEMYVWMNEAFAFVINQLDFPEI